MKFKKALAAVKMYYQNFKENNKINTEIKQYLEKINTESAYDILLSFDEAEEV